VDGIGHLSLRGVSVYNGEKVRICLKGKFNFNQFDPKEEKFISIRECQGRGRGLPEINMLKLSEAMKNDEYKELIASLRNQCYSILKIPLPE